MEPLFAASTPSLFRRISGKIPGRSALLPRPFRYGRCPRSGNTPMSISSASSKDTSLALLMVCSDFHSDVAAAHDNDAIPRFSAIRPVTSIPVPRLGAAVGGTIHRGKTARCCSGSQYDHIRSLGFRNPRSTSTPVWTLTPVCFIALSIRGDKSAEIGLVLRLARYGPLAAEFGALFIQIHMVSASGESGGFHSCKPLPPQP